jgi:hypothetical protein
MPMFREQSERERNIAAQIIIVSMRAADPLRQRIKGGEAQEVIDRNHRYLV